MCYCHAICPLILLCLFRVAGNGQVLLQAGYFMPSSPEQMMIENILLKLTTKAK